MCTRVTCSDCGKPSYAGCGRHVEQVLGDVPDAKRCRCREERSAEPPQSLFERIFGKQEDGRSR